MPDGLAVFDEDGAEPEPKLHKYVTPAAVPLLVKFTLAPVHCGAFDIKFAMGLAFTLMVCVAVTVQPPPPVPLYVSVMVLTPAVVYFTTGGFLSVDVAGTAPAPKFQL